MKRNLVFTYQPGVLGNLVFTIMVCTFSIVPCLRNYSLVQDIKYVLLHFLINSFHLMFMVLILIIFHLKSKFPWHHLWDWSSFPPWFAVPSFSFIFHVPIYLGIILSLVPLIYLSILTAFQPLIFAIFFMSLQKPLFFWQFLKLFSFSRDSVKFLYKCRVHEAGNHLYLLGV